MISHIICMLHVKNARAFHSYILNVEFYCGALQLKYLLLRKMKQKNEENRNQTLKSKIKSAFVCYGLMAIGLWLVKTDLTQYIFPFWPSV